MNNSRTYGIEIECVSKLDFNSLAQKINDAFEVEGINHRAVNAGYYHHTTDANNFSTWEIKTDSSIHDMDEVFPHGTEIVSPVLTGEDGLKALKVVCSVLTVYCKVGVSTGLHVHHGVQIRELRSICKAWMKIQDHIYLMVPVSRRQNRYCGKWNTNSFRSIEMLDRSSVHRWYNNYIGTRYVGLNLATYWLRGTVEFRLAAGSTDYEKISNWVVFTQSLLDNAKKLSEDVIRSFYDVSNSLKNNSTTGSGEKPPRAGSVSRMVWDMALCGYTRDQIFQAIQPRSTNMNRVKNFTRKALASRATVNVDNNISKAIAWAETRYEAFCYR